jgi:hypothetical protein
MNSFDIYGFTFLVAGLLLVLMLAWQRFKTQQLKMMSMAEITRDEAYRKLAEESIFVQQKMMKSQQEMTQDISKLRERITGIENMLREVE